jgi:hypothetical protein
MMAASGNNHMKNPNSGWRTADKEGVKRGRMMENNTEKPKMRDQVTVIRLSTGYRDRTTHSMAVQRNRGRKTKA